MLMLFKKDYRPTDKEKVLDYLTAFGATAGSPLELQTWGSSLGKAAVKLSKFSWSKGTSR
jgi:hypothetical protein